jgi:hypothetical protein
MVTRSVANPEPTLHSGNSNTSSANPDNNRENSEDIPSQSQQEPLPLPESLPLDGHLQEAIPPSEDLQEPLPQSSGTYKEKHALKRLRPHNRAGLKEQYY